MSGVHLRVGMLCGGRFNAVVGVPRAGGNMEVADTTRDGCVVSVSGGTLSCAGAPFRSFACTGDAIVGIFLDLGLLKF